MTDLAVPMARTSPRLWRRWRYWLALLVGALLAAVLVGTLSDAPGRPLDPSSAHPDGSKALVRVLTGYGVTVRTQRRVASVDLRGAPVVVVPDPDAFSATQLRRLRDGAARLVLVRPGTRTLEALLPGTAPGEDAATSTPRCAEPGARAAGRLSAPGDAGTFTTTDRAVTSCYGGLVLVAPRVTAVGSAALLTNDRLDDEGVAALDVNLLTANRTRRDVVWLLAGADADGSGPASIWDLFPGGVYRVFWWVLAVGVLLTLWRGRRLGGVVREPLPVVVRAAELVEGHGRLYRTAHAADRAGESLRDTAKNRLTVALGLPRTASDEQVADAAARRLGRDPGPVVALLTGPAPADDAALTRLALELDRLEAAVREGRR